MVINKANESIKKGDIDPIEHKLENLSNKIAVHSNPTHI